MQLINAKNKTFDQLFYKYLLRASYVLRIIHRAQDEQLDMVLALENSRMEADQDIIEVRQVL